MNRLKIVSVMLSAAMVLTLFAGCKKKTKPTNAIIVSTQATMPSTTTTEEPTVDTGTPAPSFATEETTTTFMTVETAPTTKATKKKATPTPKPTNTPRPTPSVKIAKHVKDDANILKNDAALEAKLTEFEKATKIIPVIYTVKTNLTGNDFRTYTKSIYKNNYKDQNHFLIVFRVSKNGGGWSWTSSIGTKAYAKLNKAGVASTYSSDLSKLLTSNKKDRGKAFMTFFDKYQKIITKKK